MTNFYHHIHTTLTKSRDTVLLIWPQGNDQPPLSLTGKDILEKVSAFRASLAVRGTRSGEKILFLLPVGFDLVAALLAVQSLGAIPVLPPATSTLPGLLELVFRQGIKTLLIKGKKQGVMSLLARLTGRRLIHAGNLTHAATDWMPVQVPLDQPALITHTSGSTTGRPKAINRSHRVLTAQHKALKELFPPWAGQKDYPLFPNVILHNLAAGVTTIVPGLPGFRLLEMNAPALLEDMRVHEVHTLTGNVFYFRKLTECLEKHPARFPHIRAIGIGGSPVPEPLLRSIKKHFGGTCYVIYGSSEAEPIAVRKTGDEIHDPLDGYAVGEVYKGLELRIRPAGKIKSANGSLFEVGEIEVRGPHVAAKDDWLKTGDFGYVNNSRLYLTGRKGNETIHKGVQHYQVEHLLLHARGVVQAAVRSTDKGFAVFVQGDGAADIPEIEKFLNVHLPEGIITGIKRVRQLPVDTRHHSKILYEKLN